MFLLAAAAVGVVGAVYVSGHRFPTEKQAQVKQLAVAALALLGFLFAVVFARGFFRGAVSAALIGVALVAMGGGAAFMWVKLGPPPPRGSAPRVAAPASKSRVLVRSEPPGATVLVDGTPFAHTPASFILPHGRYQVTLRLDGYADWTETVTVAEERQLDVKLESQ